MFMRSERLFLRPLFPEDWREVYRAVADFEVVRMLARAPWPYAARDAMQFCRTPAPAGAMRFAITLPGQSGAPLVGLIGIEPVFGQTHELGYWIGREWQRRGLGTEAVGAVLEVARAMGIARVHAGHFLENPASGKVLRANGFVETGEVRPTPCLARGGEAVLTRRYVRELAVPVGAEALRAA